MKCGDEVIKADAYVMAFGSYSTAMLKGIVDIPVYPLKGYSLTIPIAQEDGAPVSTILDETYKIAITRFDNRIRVGGMAEIVGFNTELLQPRRETLEMVVRDLYPRGGHVEQATFWTGLRPMTPDGTPVVGRTRFKNLWLNTGHGTLGWTMACGSGQLLSDLLSGRTPAIPYEDLSVARYSRGFTPSRPGHLHGAQLKRDDPSDTGQPRSAGIKTESVHCPPGRAARARLVGGKANAYGHGIERIWSALGATDGFALLNLEEAITLRERGWKGPILMLEGFSMLRIWRFMTSTA